MKVNSEKERLLCYSAGIFDAMLSNSVTTQFQTTDGLMRQSIRLANEMIHAIYDDEKLAEILK